MKYVLIPALFILMAAIPKWKEIDEGQSQYLSAFNFRAIEFNLIPSLNRDVKYGYNLDIDIASGREIIAAQGGAFTRPTSAERISIVSTSPNDTNGGTGAWVVEVRCIKEDFSLETENVVLSGTTPTLTTSECLYINRIIVISGGTSETNLGTITATQETSGIVLRQIPIASGITQSCLYTVPKGKVSIVERVTFTVIRDGGGSAIVRFWGNLYLPEQGLSYRPFLISEDTGVHAGPLSIDDPFTTVRNEGDVIWFEAETTRDDTQATCRMIVTERDIS